MERSRFGYVGRQSIRQLPSLINFRSSHDDDLVKYLILTSPAPSSLLSTGMSWLRMTLKQIQGHFNGIPNLKFTPIRH